MENGEERVLSLCRIRERQRSDRYGCFCRSRERDKDPSGTAALLRIIHCFAVCTYRARPVLTPSFKYVPSPSYTLFRVLPSTRMTYGFGDKPQYIKWVIISFAVAILAQGFRSPGVECRIICNLVRSSGKPKGQQCL